MELYQPDTNVTEAPATYGAYRNDGGQYGDARYGYTNGANPTYTTYGAQEPARKAKKKKKASPVARAIGVLCASVLVIAAALLVAFAFLNASRPGEGTGTGTPGTTDTALIDEGGTTGEDTEKDTNSPAENPGEGSTVVTTIQSTDMSIIATDVTEVVKKAMPFVVIIDNNFTARQRTIYGVYEEEQMGTGSGVIIGKSDNELLIVTNNHVVSGANSLQVQFMDGERAEAEINGTNAAMDLAVVSVKLADLPQSTQDGVKIAVLGDSDTLQLGEPVIAIGNALGYGQSVTTGVVSALNREITLQDGTNGTFIQTDAAINEGNSGGALLNSKGELIGINSAKLGGSTVEGMGFAIPITQARDRIERLMNLGSKIKYNENEKGYLGISVMTPQGIKGAYVQTVMAESAAARGGMEEGDIIIAVDDLEIGSRDDLLNALNYYPAGAEVTITVSRKTLAGQNEIKLNITLQSA